MEQKNHPPIWGFSGLKENSLIIQYHSLLLYHAFHWSNGSMINRVNWFCCLNPDYFGHGIILSPRTNSERRKRAKRMYYLLMINIVLPVTSQITFWPVCTYLIFFWTEYSDNDQERHDRTCNIFCDYIMKLNWEIKSMKINGKIFCLIYSLFYS